MVEAVARGVPAGLGEPVFDKLEADLAKAMLSLPAAKGFEIGSGFARHAADRQPAQRSVLQRPAGTVRTRTQPLGRRAGRHLERRGHRRARRVQADRDDPARAGDRRRGRQRHDDQGAAAATIPCVLPRAVPIVEAMMALVLADHFLRQRGQCG